MTPVAVALQDRCVCVCVGGGGANPSLATFVLKTSGLEIDTLLISCLN